jgi:Zn-dependent protease
VLAWLAYINLFLLAFNLLPALPLDGGRSVPIGALETGRDFAWATFVAAGVGRDFGMLMVVGGVFVFFASGVASGLWLAVVGWFLFGAAGSEGELVRMRNARGPLDGSFRDAA